MLGAFPTRASSGQKNDGHLHVHSGSKPVGPCKKISIMIMFWTMNHILGAAVVKRSTHSER